MLLLPCQDGALFQPQSLANVYNWVYMTIASTMFDRELHF